MAQANTDMGIFKQNKVTDEILMHDLAGYCVFATNAPSQNRRGVAVIYRDAPHF